MERDSMVTIGEEVSDSLSLKEKKVSYLVGYLKTLQYTAKFMQLSSNLFIICLQLPVSSW